MNQWEQHECHAKAIMDVVIMNSIVRVAQVPYCCTLAATAPATACISKNEPFYAMCFCGCGEKGYCGIRWFSSLQKKPVQIPNFSMCLL